MTHSSSISVNTAAVQSLSTKFDQNVASLSSSVAQRVSVPKDINGRKAFLKNLAAKSAARLAAGGTALILVLLSTSEAQAQDATGVTLSSIEGVQSVEILADGSAVVTMESGAQMRLPADSFTQAGGEIIVSDAVAAQIGEAAAVAGGGSIGAIAGVAGGLAAVAGGGSSSSAGETALPTQAGSVVDGYIVNATVFQDVNGNGIFDQNEPNTTTDDKGEFNLTLDPSNPTAKLISFGGTDSSTGQDFTGTLTAPAGSDVITPLTTLVQSLVEKSAEDGEPISVEDANTQLAEALGLDGQNLLELDPVAAVETGGGADAFAAAAQVASVISAAAAAQDDGDVDGEASGAAAATLAEQLLAANADGNANAEDVLNDAAVIQQALEDAGVDSAEANGVAAQIEAANDLIDNAADGGGNVQDIQSTIETVQEVVQGTVVDAIQDDNTALDEIDVVDQVDNLAPLRPVVHKSVGGTLGGEALAEGVFLSGTGRPESQVRVTIGDESKTVEVGSDGNWEVTFVTAELPSESGTFEAEVSAAQAGSSIFTVPVSGGSFEVDLTGPAAPTFDPVAENDILEVAEQGIALTVTGTAEANATIAVTISGTTVREEVAGDGTFSVMFDPEDIPEADFSITAVATDSLGNEGQEATHSVAVEVPVHVVEGTSGDDLLTGTVGNDDIDPMGNDRGNDSIVGSTGNDTIDLSNSGDESFVTLDYGSLTGPISAELNFADNTGTVDKGADGTDTVTSPETTAEADGFRLLGTSGDDTFTVTQDEDYTSVQLHHAGGNDTVNATLNEGKLRFGILSNEDVTANLAAGDVNFASGSVELNITGPVSGSGRFELLTSDGDDSVTGSDLGEQFILGGGTDTLDAAGGYDVVRYDRNGISGGVNVDLAAGTATGTWNGEAFTHSISNVEEVRGTKGGNDTLTASDSGSHLRGNGGNDSLVGGAGNDLLDGGDGEDTFVVGLGDDTIRGYVDADDQVEFSPELTEEQINAMIAAAQQDGDDVVLTLPNSATVRIENWTVAELQASHAGDGSGGETNPINGTSGDDTLTGTDGNDAIDPMGNDAGDDLIIGSSGNDTIDLSNSGGESFVSLDYKALDAPISVELDYTKDLGTVDKGVNGTDTLTSPETTAEAEGLSLTGTSGDDTFNVVQGTDSTWTKVAFQGGDDTVTAVLNQGTLRLTTTDEDVTADLATGNISFTGGSIDLDVTGPVDGSGRIELETGDGDDAVTGSDLDERFILGGGTDTLDAGGGHDVVRYDRNGIDGGVAVNLATGTATGTWNGEAFTHSLTNVEEVRGTREGDDTLTASDSGSTLRGRGGDDSLVGGDGEDVFIVGEGHDTISNFDFEVDNLVTPEGGFDGTLPEFTEVEVGGEPAVRFDLGSDSSVTVTGISEKGFQNLVIGQALSLSPGAMSDPVTMTVSGNADYALIIRAVTETLVTNTPTELAFVDSTPSGLAQFSIVGTGLSITGTPGSEVFTGTVSSATLTLDGSEVVSITDLNIPMTDFVAMVDSIQDNGNFNAGFGLGERDLILVANDVEQTIFVSGVDQWIEVNGSGADTVSFDGGGNAAIILGDGDDTVNISDSTPSEDRAFIYIDAESTGVKAINGFRFTNDPETGDRLVIEDTRGDFSIARLVDDIDDQDALNAIADEFAGQGEYALFYENSGDAVLLEFASGNTLGDTVATFTNADVSAFNGSNIDGYMKFLDIELPAASELV